MNGCFRGVPRCVLTLRTIIESRLADQTRKCFDFEWLLQPESCTTVEALLSLFHSSPSLYSIVKHIVRANDQSFGVTKYSVPVQKRESKIHPVLKIIAENRNTHFHDDGLWLMVTISQLTNILYHNNNAFTPSITLLYHFISKKAC